MENNRTGSAEECLEESALVIKRIEEAHKDKKRKHFPPPTLVFHAASSKEKHEATQYTASVEPRRNYKNEAYVDPRLRSCILSEKEKYQLDFCKNTLLFFRGALLLY